MFHPHLSCGNQQCTRVRCATTQGSFGPGYHGVMRRTWLRARWRRVRAAARHMVTTKNQGDFFSRLAASQPFRLAADASRQKIKKIKKKQNTRSQREEIGGGDLKVSTCRRSKRGKKNREKRSAAARYLGEPETVLLDQQQGRR